MINIEALTKKFDDFYALKNINFVIDEGMFLGVLGPNGAGKTTLIKTMIGMHLPTEGQIVFDGQVMHRDQLALKNKIGVVSQHVNLDKELTVKENMIFAGKLYRMQRADIERRIIELFDLLNLHEITNNQVRWLSGGMKRKLMIAKALIHQPSYLFLDEPTVGIDVMTRREIWKFLKDYHRAGNTVILTTHYIEEAEQLCEMLLLINRGEIFKHGTANQLIGEIGHFKVENEKMTEYYNTLDEAKAAIDNFEGLVRVVNTTLEDVFFYYTNEAKQWE